MPGAPTSLANQLLVALPSLADPHFARSVTLLCQHDAEGAMGVMVNRPSEYTLGEVFDQMGIASADADLRARQVLTGGPVHPERGFVLHDGHAWDSSLPIADDLFVTTSRDVLEALAAGTGPRSVTVALGCAGWGAGQLEHELAENSWLTVPADDRAVLFTLPLPARWQAAAARLGVDLARMTDYSGHA